MKKIARICWNSNNWMKPSGRVGKSPDKDSYENMYGYGYEEWLFDLSKIVDGYHYSYLQAIGRHRNTYLNEVFDISLYSINSKTKQHWWIGEILNVEVVSPEDSKKIYKRYKAKGWYKEMLEHLNAVGADIEEFKRNVTPEAFAIIRFKPSDLELLEQPLEFFHDDPAVTSDYYNLKNKIVDPTLQAPSKFQFKSGHNAGKDQTQRTYSEHSGDVSLAHNDLQTKLYDELVEQYGKSNVGTENQCGSGNRIDIVVKQGKKFSLYEIKTLLTVKACIREAIGQLLEYSYYYDTIEIDQLVIASPHEIKNEDEEYLSRLKGKYKLNISYRKI